MNNKKQQLKKHKLIATGLFFLMAVIYVFMLFLSKYTNQSWINYVKYFSEAAMVGALADWFAVTALFKYPLGIKIPHTNLINNNKNALGANLGNFVSENFLNQETIRPYISKIDLSKFILNWISNEKNFNKFIVEMQIVLKNIILKVDDVEISKLISVKGKEIIDEVNLQVLISKGLFYVLEIREHQRLISLIIPQAKHYVENNKEAIYDKVVEKNPILGLIGGKAVTNQLISGIISFLDDIESNENHTIRNEISSKLYEISETIQTDQNWKVRFENLKNDFITDEKIQEFAIKFWQNSKLSLIDNLENQNSTLNQYIEKYLKEIRENLRDNLIMQAKINQTVQKMIYKLALKNSSEIGNIISKTVHDWDGQELSEKLELEVGKDLQFIRINGTLVGGIVGLLIYSLTQLFT
ncbi:DUF445 domain-containing protein [Flavobacterium sp. I3-2]|uniref:DUF445 domain-containing protein n=1 Tax=Flavobacterium sp. I3-2 TaxID=2748319 RepID=UPI0015AE0662|nr:DUF445 domain-containing protein [Flavobacterium sp. I3-2]